MLQFVLCDDNKPALDRIVTTLNSILENHDINAKISFATTSANKLLKYVQTNKFDVIFLDIDLASEISGIDIARQIRKVNKNAYIIFLTAHFEYSMLAYKVKTFDFLVKPIMYSNLEETVIRLLDDVEDNNNTFVKFNGSNRLYRANDILYIEKDRAKAVIHTTISNFQIYGSFDNIKSCLPEYFVRCNKSFIINTQKITNINSKNRTLCIGNDEINYTSRYINNERMLMLNEKFIN